MVATAVVAAQPASAAAPRCTGSGFRESVMLDEDGMSRDIVYFPAHSPGTETVPRTPGGWGFWSCSLVYGSTGVGVWKLQGEINKCYIETGVITGVAPLNQDYQFGTLTKGALIKVQQSLGITANGQYGPETARTMRHPYVEYTPYDDTHCGQLALFGWPGNSG